jgi:hypothetical protein
MSASNISRLAERRGTERVSFADVADHLRDFVRLDPGASATVERLAMYLTEVETIPHDHDALDEGSVAVGADHMAHETGGRA